MRSPRGTTFSRRSQKDLLFGPGTGVVSHTAYIGDFAGPYPFYEGEQLID